MNQPQQRPDRLVCRAGRRRRPLAVAVLLVGLVVVPMLSGCASGLPAWARGDRDTESAKTAQGEQSAPTPPAAPSKPSAPPTDVVPPPTPQWRTTGEALGINEPARTPVPMGEGKPVFTPFSVTLPELRLEVASICGSARVGKQKGFLAPLVTDLYLSNVDPAFATEALIQGDCGSLAAVVREMVAQGGSEVVPAVVNRALFLSGPRAEATIRAAAASGLNRDLATPMQGSESSRDAGSLAYSMAYFPSRAPESGLATSATINTLYSNATPGYGIYTFVLLGGAFNPSLEADRARYAELLRVIETYVLAGDGVSRGPTAEAHTFLVAVRPDPGKGKLVERTTPELSAAMRKDLAQYLRSRDQAVLAERLETLPGPFLISSLEPRLMPTNEVAPRLVSDLSNIGSEYLYAVVDAYDRPVPPDQQGRPEGLAAIRDRLLGLFSRKVPAEDLSPAIKDAWVFRLGAAAVPKPGEAVAGAASSQPKPPSGEAVAAPDAGASPAEQAGPKPAAPPAQVPNPVPSKAVSR